ncbi:hypothetical protein MTO98_23780 [Mucilaginibacter sp. SMC90]|uniref:hypothetical protein n=1 Tax=Mucilaginibacter sp. SMC90 TaxID=2929803 RepID=UPI001FB2495A|nr:hypothetical protein [Mucilaginibacter sp. SMC90]UOE47431.1 hypothetical protein MTO98_23780 [Mucilaginibacter sp. SMC90]
MKYFIFFLFAIIVLDSCSKHNDPQIQLDPKKATMSDLAGQWHVQLDTMYKLTGGAATVTQIDHAPLPADRIDFLQFNTDGTCSSGHTTATEFFTYTVANGIITDQQKASDGSPSNKSYATILAITRNSLLLRQNNTTAYTDVYLTK